jgi:protein-disulfide isomerase
MIISAVLAVLLVVSVYMNYSLVKTALAKPGTQIAAPTPTAAAAADEPAAKKVDITLKESDHIRGSKNAPVIIVEYSDFECPYCKRAAPTVEEIRKTYGDKVAIVFRQFPLGFHANAKPAAMATECAAEQGKFWEYHDILFDKSPALTQNDLISYAKSLSLDEKKFTDCLTSKKYEGKVNSDMSEGQTLGVQGTPAFFINGNLISGAYPFSEFKKRIDAELQ